MKKLFSKLAVICLAVCLLFSATGCNVVEDGVIIKYAVVSLDFYNAEGSVEATETLTIKLYTNYAPKTCERFIKLASDNFYNGKCVNNVRSGWCSLGGYEFGENDKLVEKVTDLGYLSVDDAEFEKAGWTGNKLTSSQGAVFLYRDFDDSEKPSTYGTGANEFGMLFSSVSTFATSSYAYFGKVVSDDFDVLTKISDLQYKAATDDESENEYKYYYNGALKAVSEGILLTDDFAKTNSITAEDKTTVENKAEGYMTNEEYEDFYAVAEKFISGNQNDYFFVVPQTKVLINKIEIKNKI